jgi:hypothetical protein
MLLLGRVFIFILLYLWGWQNIVIYMFANLCYTPVNSLTAYTHFITEGTFQPADYAANVKKGITVLENANYISPTWCGQIDLLWCYNKLTSLEGTCMDISIVEQVREFCHNYNTLILWLCELGDSNCSLLINPTNLLENYNNISPI